MMRRCTIAARGDAGLGERAELDFVQSRAQCCAARHLCTRTTAQMAEAAREAL